MIRVALITIFAWLACSPAAKADEPFDLVIRNGRVIDGTGAPWYKADIGIRNGKIAKIGRIDFEDGREVIDAHGLMVAPGFIDMLGQTATPLLDDSKSALKLLTQGITTINAGVGDSAAPLDAAAGRARGWTTMAEYFQLLDMRGLPVNIVQTVEHTQLRRIVMGEVERLPSKEDFGQMKLLVRKAMQAGAIGLSTDLSYPVAATTTKLEIAELAKVVGQYGGGYYTHMRYEDDRLVEAIDEVLRIGRAAGTAVHVFDLEVADQASRPKIPQALGKIQAARVGGQQVTADICPDVDIDSGVSEANKILIMQQPFVSFCTDAGPAGQSRTASHRRAYGSFPRLLAHYVRDLGAISLNRAVAQASAVAAHEIMAHDRGRIAEGLAADIIVFDYEKIAEPATPGKPNQLSAGMQYVLVNGEVTLWSGNFLNKRSGRVLRGPGFNPASASHNIATGELPHELASFDWMMRNFIKKHHVPGAALAVTDQGRLVLARGYGLADIAAVESVKPTSLFRIASISKPITSVAILQLVEQGKLKLDDKVFEILKYEPYLEDGANFDERHRTITIRHLLEHRGGWDREKSFDGMYCSVEFAQALEVAPPAGHQQIIRCMLGRQLDFEPGERYAYSNFGYCLLGRVIESITGLSYEDYVKLHVLAPIGITSMRIGKSRLDGRAKHEVRYYHPLRGSSVFSTDLGQPVPFAYGGWHHESLDAHGGWIGSAVDLARFAAALDDPSDCKLLKPESFMELYVRPKGLAGFDEIGNPRDVYYTLGWMNRDVVSAGTNRWHTGSMPGTAAILIRRHDGRNFVALFNARMSQHASHLGREIDSLLHEAADAVKRWPKLDRFDEF